MQTLDIIVIACYFAIVIGAGFWYQRRASQNLESYFLGGKRIHWLALAMSGSVSNFDITGTMWMVTLLTLFGMKSMWNHWMWGFLMGAFFLAFMGKWIRRSRMMTGAEWMATRFGTGRDGFTARISYTLMAVVTVAGFIGYAFQGIGKFSSVLLAGIGLDWDPQVCAIAIFGITTLYVLLGGLYSVVITDVIQTVVLTFGAILVAALAWQKTDPETLARVLPTDWTSLAPVWRLDKAALPNDYAVYECFGALVIVWVIKGLMLNLGGPAQMYDFQRFLAARDPRDAAKVGAAWSGFLVCRWAMVMGIALLALSGFENVDDPEKVMPLVLEEYLWTGIRGLVVAGLLAAFMSTFSSTVNSGASYIVRDLWQPLFRPHASQKQLIYASYAATLGLVLVGIVIGLNADSIRGVWDWIMGALGAAFIVPNVLRWYWWRLNGWGYAIGTLFGLAAALIVPFEPSWRPMYVSFPLVSIVSLVATLAATWATRPTDRRILTSFYEDVRPFGVWGPVRRQASVISDAAQRSCESPLLAVTNVLLGMIAIGAIYFGPMYLVGRWYFAATFCLAAASAAIIALYFTWYLNLPPAERDEVP